MNKKIITILMFFCAFFVVGCSSFYPQQKILYSNSGLQNENLFQVLVIGKPANNARGLNEERETALKNAQTEQIDVVFSELVKYYIALHVEAGNIENEKVTRQKIASSTRSTLMNYASKSENVAVYYNEKNEAILVCQLKISKINYKLLKLVPFETLSQETKNE